MLNSYSPTLLAATAALFVASFFGIITAGFLTLARPRITINRRLARLGLSDRNVDRPVRQALTSRQKRIQDRVQSLETRKKKEGPQIQNQIRKTRHPPVGNSPNEILEAGLSETTLVQTATKKFVPNKRRTPRATYKNQH